MAVLSAGGYHGMQRLGVGMGTAPGDQVVCSSGWGQGQPCAWSNGM